MVYRVRWRWGRWRIAREKGGLQTERGGGGGGWELLHSSHLPQLLQLVDSHALKPLLVLAHLLNAGEAQRAATPIPGVRQRGEEEEEEEEEHTSL